MTPLVARFVEDEAGTTVIEYALIGVGISVAILATASSKTAPALRRLSMASIAAGIAVASLTAVTAFGTDL